MSALDFSILQALQSFGGSLSGDLGLQLMSTMHIAISFHLYHNKSVIKLQTKSNPVHVRHCGDTPVADREVQYLSDLNVAE